MSSPAVFLFEKFPCLYSGGAWQASLPLTNLDNADLGVVARSVGATNSATRFTIDLGSVYPVGGIILCSTNMSPGSTYRMRGFSNAAHTVLVKDTGIKTMPGQVFDWANTGTWPPWEDIGFWEGILDIKNVKEWPRDLIEIFDVDVNAQHWLIDLFDASNTDGYVQVAFNMIARAFRPSINYVPGDNGLSIAFDTATRKSIGGLETHWEKSERRTWRGAFPERLSETEMFGQLLKMIKRSKTSRPVYVVPDPEDTTNLRMRSFLARMTAAPSLAQVNVALGSAAFDFVEITPPSVT